VEEPSASEDEVAVGKLKRYKFPGVDQFLAELVHAEAGTWRLEIHKLIKLFWDKEEFSTSGKSELWYLFTKRIMKLTVVMMKE
jgi:hypothetical protein